jgi:cysteine-S-conjugate beta-lyase
MEQARTRTGESWERSWCGLRFLVERRTVEGDRGATLRIASVAEGPADGAGPEWLRFDCFERQPHWHLAPDDYDERQPLDERGDPIAQSVELLDAELPHLLERAGAPKPLARAVADASCAPERRRLLRALESALRHRPARLDDLDLRQLEARRSEKWHTYPRDVLPAWVAEMDFPIAAPIERELLRFTTANDIGYPPGLRQSGVAEAFAEHMVDRFDWTPDPARVEVLSEVVQGLYLAVAAFSAPGDGAIVQTPIYPPFLNAVVEQQRRVVENRLVPDGAGLGFDLDALARAIDGGTRLLLLCNPHNPSGHVATRGELERLAELALAHDLVVVVDEIHADLVYTGARHVPFATLAPEIARRTVTLSSASKAFNIPGLRCAVAHFGDAALQQRFNAVVPKKIRGGLGLFGLAASVAAWRFGQPWLDELVPYLEANRDYAEAFLARQVPEIRFHRPQATYLAWLDCAGLGLATPPAPHFLQHGRVALSDGRTFGSGFDGYARLNFATSRPILQAILERMTSALGRSPAGRSA